MCKPTKPPSHRLRGDDGAALVEFALILPLLCMLLLGMLSAGFAWNQKMQLTHAAREAARYGATIPASQNGHFTSGQTWAQVVAATLQNRAGSDLDVEGATMCVSLVQNISATNTNPTVVTSSNNGFAVRYTHSASGWSSPTNGGAPCIPTETYTPAGNDDLGRRVQVTVTRPGKIEALAFSADVTLTSNATAKAESQAT